MKTSQHVTYPSFAFSILRSIACFPPFYTHGNYTEDIQVKIVLEDICVSTPPILLLHPFASKPQASPPNSGLRQTGQ